MDPLPWSHLWTIRDGRIVRSESCRDGDVRRLVATDFFGLHRPSRCALRVWLRHHRVEESPRGPFADLLIATGNEHEAAHLARYPDHLDLGSFDIAERVERTRDAISSCSGVVYQGALSATTTLAGINVEIVGVPDFLLPSGTSYLVRDSKLARRIDEGSHPEIALQMETYGWLYERTFGSPPVALQIHNGADEIRDVPYDGVLTHRPMNRMTAGSSQPRISIVYPYDVTAGE